MKKVCPILSIGMAIAQQTQAYSSPEEAFYAECIGTDCMFCNEGHNNAFCVISGQKCSETPLPEPPKEEKHVD